MDQATRQSILKAFFGAHFHQDWPYEAANPEAIISRYAAAATPADVHSLAHAIQEYSNAFTDRELEAKLFRELGCYYCPSADGLDAKAWLEQVATQLLREK